MVNVLTPEQLEEYRERAAIMEYDAGMTREQAEREALKLIHSKPRRKEQKPMATCKSCGAQIIWSRTEADKPIPIDPEPVYGGNVVLECSWALARVVKPLNDVKRHMSHFVTCQTAARHRKR